MDPLIALTIFVLALFVGIEIITKVPPTLHTPLMSGSNAISGITLVGALFQAGIALTAADPMGVSYYAGGVFYYLLGFLAVIFATVNVVGGFLVTHRMLSMFRRKD
ncbi:MAG: NAD(P) transhydrogenase subunit alpha [Planctomycetales bacterium]